MITDNTMKTITECPTYKGTQNKAMAEIKTKKIKSQWLVNHHFFLLVVAFGGDGAVCVSQRHPRHQTAPAQLGPNQMIVQGENFGRSQGSTFASQNS